MEISTFDNYRLFTKHAPDGSLFFTATFNAAANLTTIQSFYRHIAMVIESAHFTIAQERIFGDQAISNAIMEIRTAALPAHFNPVQPTVLSGNAVHGGTIAGILIRAVPEKNTTPIEKEGQIVGMKWNWGEDTFALIGGLTGHGESPAEQTHSLLQNTKTIATHLGFTLNHIVRTWFYLDNILNWYDEFNRVRTKVFSDWNLLPSSDDVYLRLPASTGIGVQNNLGKAVVADVMLAKPVGRVVQLSNPGQKDAFWYGSAFSRGATVSLDSAKILQLSGTASINENGTTVFKNEPRAQIQCTIEKVDALLTPQQFSIENLASGVAFFKHSEDADLLNEMLHHRNLSKVHLPLVCVQAHVCRDDLLFEMDGELVS